MNTDQKPTKTTNGSFAKLAFLFGIAFTVLLAIYGGSTFFLPSNAYWQLMLVPSIAATAGFAYAFHRFFNSSAKPPEPAGGQRDPLARWIMSPHMGKLSAVAASIFIYPALQYGVPAIASDFLDGQTELELLDVREPTWRGSGAFCWGYLSVSHHKFGKTGLCGIPDNLRQSAKVGDKIQISGQVTYFGVRYETCTLIKRK